MVKKDIKDLKLPESAGVNNKVIRRYNLGGFNNWIEIEMGISGPAKEVRDNLENLEYLNAHITKRLGSVIYKCRKKIKINTGEEYDDDGKVVDSEDNE